MPLVKYNVSSKPNTNYEQNTQEIIDNSSN